MIPFRQSIGFRLLAISFILLALPLLIDSFILMQKSYEHSIEDAKAYLVEVSNVRELPISQIEPLNETLLSLFIKTLNLESDFPEKPDEALDQKLAKIASVGDFFSVFLIKITDEGEYFIVASGGEEFIGKNVTDFFELYSIYSPDPDRPYQTYISYDDQIPKPFFIVLKTIYSKENKPIGVIAISAEIDQKLQEFLKVQRETFPVNFALLLPSSIVFAATEPDLNFQYFLPLEERYKLLFKQVNPSATNEIPDQPIKTEDAIGFPFFEFNWKDHEYIGYKQRVRDANFSLLTYAAKEEIFKSPIKNFIHVYSIYGMILVFGATISWFLTRRMGKPIQDLSKVMIGIQSGNLDLRYKKDSLGFEINTLGGFFNEMIDNLLKQKLLAEEESVNRETLAKELRLGQQVQRSLFPQTMPAYPNVELAELYIPAIEVGGDFYDVFLRGDESNRKLAIAIADASGKGVRACFYSLSVRNMMRIFAKEYDNAARAMVAANNAFCKDTGDTGMFVTAFLGIYDYQTGIFEYFSSGHNPPYVLRENGTLEKLEHHAMAMGVNVQEESEAFANSILLQPQDVVILYTDGITEAHNVENKLYGEKRLEECLRSCRGKSAEFFIEFIIQDVNKFCGAAGQFDDITLLVMKINND